MVGSEWYLSGSLAGGIEGAVELIDQVACSLVGVRQEAQVLVAGIPVAVDLRYITCICVETLNPKP